MKTKINFYGEEFNKIPKLNKSLVKELNLIYRFIFLNLSQETLKNCPNCPPIIPVSEIKNMKINEIEIDKTARVFGYLFENYKLKINNLYDEIFSEYIFTNIDNKIVVFTLPYLSNGTELFTKQKIEIFFVKKTKVIKEKILMENLEYFRTNYKDGDIETYTNVVFVEVGKIIKKV